MEGTGRCGNFYGLPTDCDGDLVQQVKDTIHPEDRARSGGGIRCCAAFSRAAIRIRSSAFSREWCRTAFHPGKVHRVRSETGTGERMVGINWDVTAERRREDSLLQASRMRQISREAQAGNRAKSEFLAVMSHEIRDPNEWDSRFRRAAG